MATLPTKNKPSLPLQNTLQGINRTLYNPIITIHMKTPRYRSNLSSGIC